MSLNRNVGNLSDDELVEALLDCECVLDKTEMALEAEAGGEGQHDADETARASAALGIVQDAREVFGRELLRRLVETRL